MIGSKLLLLSFVPAFAGILLAIGIRCLSTSVEDEATMTDPYFGLIHFVACGPLALLYTCVAHAWLAVVNRTGGEKNPIPLPSKDEMMRRKVAIVTGSNTGIGYAVSKRLVREYGWDVILACRTKDKALIARDKINHFDRDHNTDGNTNATSGKAIVLDPVLDLSNFDSIRRFVDALEKEYDNVDVLINNAGLNRSGRSPENPDLDLMFQSNYLGHFLLTDLLLKNTLLLSSSSTEVGNKVINLSSVMHHFSKGDSLNGEGLESVASPEYWKRRAYYSDGKGAPQNVYAASKLAAILHSLELNRRYADARLTAIAVNPGAVNSDIWRGFPRWLREYVFEKVYLTTEEGSEPIVAAAVRNNLIADKNSIMANNGRDDVIYVQPYANPFSIFGGRLFPDSTSSRTAAVPSTQQGPMIPFTELLGPYVGHIATIPRLPTNKEAAAEALWKVSKELTES
uniref:Protochlorophyllide reductase n=1 Tax=Pseudo-nitzschia australis TaxID=44445 RepID=A0A7S4EP80_9STRA